MNAIPVGYEPENIKKRLDRLFQKLNDAYPDHIIKGLYSDHKKWGETVTELYRLLGYENSSQFLEAYGYKVEREKGGGRPTVDFASVIEELKNRYPDGYIGNVSKISKDNPDLAPKIKTIQNKSIELFGMPFKDYLISVGIMRGDSKDSLDSVILTLKTRYEKNGVTAKSITQIKIANNDLQLHNLEKQIQEYYGDPKVYLRKQGILEESGPEDKKEKLDQTIAELKARYTEGKRPAYSLYQLKVDNDDLKLYAIEKQIKEIYGDPKKYLVDQGILRERPQEKRFYSNKNNNTQIRGKLKSVNAGRTRIPSLNARDYLISQNNEHDINYEPYEIEYNSPLNIDGLGGFTVENGILIAYEGPAGDVVIPEGVVGIAKGKSNESVFAGKIPIMWTVDTVYEPIKVTSITLPSSMKKVSKYGFANCPYLVEVNLPEDLKEIDEDAFSGCTVLEKVNFPDGIRLIGEWAFSRTNIHEVVIPGGAVVGTGAFTSSTIKRASFGYGFSRISTYCFSNSEIESVDLPDSVVRIERGAFENCAKLKHLKISSNLVSIGVDAFKGCKSISAIVFPAALKLIEEKAFQDCCGLKEIQFTGEIQKIGGFTGCTQLEKVLLPEHLLVLDDGAFCDCKSITSVSLPETTENIGARAFYNCENLQTININSNLKYIGDYAFHGCSRLTDIIIPSTVSAIGFGAFKGCNGLADKNGFVVVNGILFDYCGSGGEIVIPSSVTTIAGYSFFRCTKITKVIIPPSVQVIDDGAFNECTKLKSVHIDGGLKYIGKKAFSDCRSLVSIFISETAGIIEEDAFAGCIMLESIAAPVSQQEKLNNLITGSSIVLFFENGRLLRGFSNCSSVSWPIKSGSWKNYPEQFWKDYDMEMLNTSNDVRPSVRLRVALCRLYNPEYLSKELETEYINLLEKSIDRVIEIAEEEDRPEYVNVILTYGLFGTLDFEDFYYRIALSKSPVIAALAPFVEKLSDGTPKQTLNGNNTKETKNMLNDLSMYEEVSKEFFAPSGKYPMTGPDYYCTQTILRGYKRDIMKLKDYLDSIPKRYELREIEDDIFELKLIDADVTPSAVSKFPALRATGMREYFKKVSVEVWYSESGYPDFTDNEQVGEFHPEAEGGDARWAWEYDMMDDIKCWFDWDGDTIDVDYRYPFRKQWNNKDYITEIDGKFYRKKTSDQNDERVTAYVSDDDPKLFSAKYSNPLLENILLKYNYKSADFEDPYCIHWFDKKIPNYAGVTSLEKFTATLIAALLAFGSADDGLESEIREKQNEIMKDFVYIEGTSLEDTDWVADDYDGLCEGYDFSLKDGNYYAEFRTCPGGW